MYRSGHPSAAWLHEEGRLRRAEPAPPITPPAYIEAADILAAKLSAASRCWPGSTQPYLSSVNATVECPSLSVTTCGGTLAFSRRVAWVWRQS